MNTLFKRGVTASYMTTRREFSSQILKQKMEHAIAVRQKEAMEFRKEHANTVIGEV